MITSACIGIPAFNVCMDPLDMAQGPRGAKRRSADTRCGQPHKSRSVTRGPGGLSGPVRGTGCGLGDPENPKRVAGFPTFVVFFEVTLVAEPGRPTDFVESLVSPPCQLQKCQKTRAATYGPCCPPSILQLTM